ncbi:EF-hand domain pair [Popillia japonica]|uniref:EF-hand domain pair n=1 Tax=Popillia japonica TaxID=7064 RepID=A0AAW1JHS6_POPJA
MGNQSSLLLRQEEIEQIQHETGFTPNQIERLYSRFTSLDRGDCGERIVNSFFQEVGFNDGVNFRQFIHVLAHFRPIKKNKENIVNSRMQKLKCNFRQFIHVLAHFRPIKKNKENIVNSRMQKLKFAFKMYDLDNDDLISRDELLAILHMMVGANISEDQLSSIAERTILEADQDGDQMISFEEFCNALQRTDVEQKMSIRFLN